MTPAPDRQCCHSGHACTRPAESAVRLIPVRQDVPYCRCIRRSTFWPDQAEAVTVRACQPHRAAVMALGRVQAELPLGDEVAVRTVQPDAEEGAP